MLVDVDYRLKLKLWVVNFAKVYIVQIHFIFFIECAVFKVDS